MMHFGRYSFNHDIIDYIELNGDGSYLIHLYIERRTLPERDDNGRTLSKPKVIHVQGDDAEALRIWLDEDRRADQVELELNEAHLKQHNK